MKSRVPWSVKGIEQDARATAKEAARRAGMTVGEWLNSTIYAAGEQTDTAAVAAPSNENSDAHLGDMLDSLNRKLDRFDERNARAISKLSDSVDDTRLRLDDVETQRAPIAADPDSGRLDETRALRDLKRAHDELNTRLEDIELETRRELRRGGASELKLAVSRLADFVEQNQNDSRMRMNAAERDIANMHETVADLQAGVQGGQKDLDQKMAALTERLETLESATTRIETDLIERAEEAARATAEDATKNADQSEIINALEVRLQALTDELARGDKRASEIERTLENAPNAADAVAQDLRALKEDLAAQDERIEQIVKTQMAQAVEAALAGFEPPAAQPTELEEAQADEDVVTLAEDSIAPATDEASANDEADAALLEDDSAAAAGAAFDRLLDEEIESAERDDAEAKPASASDLQLSMSGDISRKAEDRLRVLRVPTEEQQPSQVEPSPVERDYVADAPVDDLTPPQADYLSSARLAAQRADDEPPAQTGDVWHAPYRAPVRRKSRVGTLLLGLCLGLTATAAGAAIVMLDAKPSQLSSLIYRDAIAAEAPAPAPIVNESTFVSDAISSQDESAAAAATEQYDPAQAHAEAAALLDSNDPAAIVRGVEIIRQAAYANHPPAQLLYAQLHQSGRGVDRDPDSALIWFERAAHAGNIQAMHLLGVTHARGDAGGKDYTQAAEWFARSAQHGYADSQFNLGVLYEQGNGVPNDFAKAYFWYAAAAEQGDASAQDRADIVSAYLSPDMLAETQARLESWTPQRADLTANGTPVAPAAPAETADPIGLVVEVQALLTRLGFDPGAADGKLGPRTVDAVRAFERQAGLPETGRVTSSLMRELQERTR